MTELAVTSTDVDTWPTTTTPKSTYLNNNLCCDYL